MYRLLAIDLDDTLLTPQRTITSHTLHTLRQVSDMGITLVIVTGRVPYLLPAALKELPLTAPLITSNGALIIERATESVLYERLFPREQMQSVLAALSEADLQWCGYGRNQLFYDQRFSERYSWSQNQTPSSPKAFLQPLDEGALAEQAYLKLAARGDATTLPEKRRQLEERFAGHLYITQTSAEWLELLHPEVSKARALHFLLNRMDIQAEEVIAFGDNYNDMEMLRFAGLSIAMGNAEPAVKALAHYITKSNVEDGIAFALEQFVLGSPRTGAGG